jgi:putative ABC transport system ATP-binding protein
VSPSSWAASCADVVVTFRTQSSEVRALRGITTDFPRGALTAVSGPSGSGKSSLLRLLAGMARPNSGSVLVEGTAIHLASGRALRRFRRRSVGYVFQRPSDNFLPYLTVGEHLRLAAGTGAAHPPFDIEELVTKLGIAHRLGHLPAELSGGEQQRAALAEVLMAGPGLVVADEPTAELDSASAASLIQTLRALVDGGIAVIAATHDPAFRRASDAAVELEHGRLVAARRGPTRATTSVAADPARSHAPWRRPGDEDRPWAGPTAPAPAPAGPMTDPEPPVLEVVGVRKSFRRGSELVHAVDSVTMSVGPGEIVGLVGRSGSGKTTLLNVMAGLEDPDEGIVRRPGREDGPPGWADLAVLPQRLGLMEELTVRGNVEWPARVAGTLEDTAPIVDELLEALGLATLESRFPPETSVGEQQRTALARAVVLSPRILLADEPTGHQDHTSARSVFSVLRAAAERGTGSLIATHNQEVVPHLDRVVAMSDGRILSGEPAPVEGFPRAVDIPLGDRPDRRSQE